MHTGAGTGQGTGNNTGPQWIIRRQSWAESTKHMDDNEQAK